MNFVGDLLSIESLQKNRHLEELYLTGNPCTDYEGYRDYVVATLPQLKTLDGKEITKSERILALQRLKELRQLIAEQQKEHREKREKEKREYDEKKAKKKEKKKPGFNKRWYTDPNSHLGGSERENSTLESGGSGEGESEEDDGFMDESIPYTPESRVETSKYIAEKRKTKSKEPE